jgi:ParB/RepB/Spo0J family partition protein
MDQLILTFERIEGVKTEFATLSLEDLSSDQEMNERGLISKPTNSFIDSIRQFGQIEPVLVLEKKKDNGKKWYQVWSGSRRIRALRQLAVYGEHDNNIRAQIIKEDWNVPYDVLLMVLNAARDSNEIADYFAIKRILLENPELNMAGIAKAMSNNLTMSEIRKRMSLAKIPDALLNGITSGMLTLHTARTITKLPKKIQIELSEKVQQSLDLLDETEKITFNTPDHKQEVIRDIIREGRIASKSIKQAKIENANQVATLKLGNLLNKNNDKSGTKIGAARSPETQFYVLPLTGAEVFASRMEAEAYRQKMTANLGMQYSIIEQ